MANPSRINGDLGPEGVAIRRLARKQGTSILYELRKAVQFYVWARGILDEGGCVYTAPSPDGEKTRVLLF